MSKVERVRCSRNRIPQDLLSLLWMGINVYTYTPNTRVYWITKPLHKAKGMNHGWFSKAKEGGSMLHLFQGALSHPLGFTQVPLFIVPHVSLFPLQQRIGPCAPVVRVSSQIPSLWFWKVSSWQTIDPAMHWWVFLSSAHCQVSRGAAWGNIFSYLEALLQNQIMYEILICSVISSVSCLFINWAFLLSTCLSINSSIHPTTQPFRQPVN